MRSPVSPGGSCQDDPTTKTAISFILVIKYVSGTISIRTVYNGAVVWGRGKKARRRGCSFYFRQPHGLVRRHTETLAIHPDHTADWRLRVDFELPTDDVAYWEDGDDRPLFLFPLVYLRKSDARTGFELHDEEGGVLVPPIREECDRISTSAAAHAVRALRPKGWDAPPLEALERRLYGIPAGNPLEASLDLSALRRAIGLEDEAGRPTESRIGDIWERAGLEEILHMLVEHTLVWISLRGRPGERRSIEVSQRISLERQPFIRSIFGCVKQPKRKWLHPLKTRSARRLAKIGPDDAGNSLLMVGDQRYCIRGRRVSFSALGERIGQPLAWMPFEFEFPTIYTKRCTSYHLEVVCPQGRSPRDLQPALGTPLAEPPKDTAEEEVKNERETDAEGDGEPRTSYGTRSAHHYRRRSKFTEDIWFRVSIGVGDGAFPGLWFLAAAITAVLLWIFAGSDPPIEGSQKEIAAGILLVVPALIAALAIGGHDVPVTQLMGGARVLLMVTGLSAVVAASVLAGARPFGFNPSWCWALCAVAATTVAVPLGASWLLSSPIVWSWLKRLSSPDSQKEYVLVGVILAAPPVIVLILLRNADAPVGRSAIAVYLLALAVAMSVVANNRAATKVGESRRYIAVSFLGAAIACLALACLELIVVVEAGSEKNQHGIQIKGGSRLGTNPFVLAGLGLMLFRAPIFGKRLSWLTRRFLPEEDEVHVSPDVGRALMAGEAVRELAIVRSREEALRETKCASGHPPAR